MAARQNGGGKNKEMSEQKRNELERSDSVFAGLPNPEELAKYEKVVPGGAERILEMAEKNAQHRREQEDKDSRNAVRTTRIRQIIAFALALVAGVFGGILMINGSELAGLIIILIDAVAVVGVAVYGERDR